MNCPECNHEVNAVIDSRPLAGTEIKRRRKCGACGHRWTTYEASVARTKPEEFFTPIEAIEWGLLKLKELNEGQKNKSDSRPSLEPVADVGPRGTGTLGNGVASDEGDHRESIPPKQRQPLVAPR